MASSDPSEPLPVRDAERRGGHSHGDRGNEGECRMKRAATKCPRSISRKTELWHFGPNYHGLRLSAFRQVAISKEVMDFEVFTPK
jgi:hypothetical protein